MPEEEKNRLYLEARQTILELCGEELVKTNSVINISNGLVIGSALSAILLGSLNPDFCYVGPILTGGIGLLLNILSRLKRRAIINNANDTAKKIVDDMTNISEMMSEIFPAFIGSEANFAVGDPVNGPIVGMGFMPMGVEICIGFDEEPAQENVIPADCEVLDENGLSLKDKCELLISYANDVGYPGYEEDIQDVTNILNVLNGGYENVNTSEYDGYICNLESIMLDKAYRFYTGDFAR